MTYEDIYSCAHDVATGDVDDAGAAPSEASGLVIKWRRRGVLWEALVSHEVDGKITTEWLPALKLAADVPTAVPPAAN